jgi:magnesium transporter
MGKILKKSRLIGQPPETLLYDGSRSRADARITIFDYDDKTLLEKAVSDVKECVVFRDKPTVTWINVDGLSRTDILEQLSSYYDVHHLVLEDILNINQRPSFEDYGEYVFISAKMLTYDEAREEIAEEQVSMVLGSNFLITFQEEKQGDVFEGIRERLRNNKGRVRKMGADYLAYCLLDAIVDNYFLILEKLGEKIEAAEDGLMVSPQAQVLTRINHLKRNLILLRKFVWPLREVTHTLTQTGCALLSEPVLPYYRDVFDHIIQAIDTIEAFRDTVSGMLDIYLTHINTRMNEVMRMLTVIATIFMPLTFIAGIYGMNFNTVSSRFNMPELNWPFGYVLVLCVMASVALWMLSYFKSRKWF